MRQSLPVLSVVYCWRTTYAFWSSCGKARQSVFSGLELGWPNSTRAAFKAASKYIEQGDISLGGQLQKYKGTGGTQKIISAASCSYRVKLVRLQDLLSGAFA